MRIILILILTVTSAMVHGQQTARTIVTKDGKVTTHLKEAYNSKLASPGKTYFYVKAGELVSTQGSFEGDLLHGLTSFYDEKGRLESKGKFKNGLKSGRWLYWGTGGQLIEIITWKKGLKNGYYKGQNTIDSYVEGEWKLNFKHGVWKTIEGGELVKVETYKMGKILEPKVRKKKKLNLKILEFKEKKKKEEEEISTPENDDDSDEKKIDEEKT